MPDYDNNMTGVLFKHDKNGNDKAPDYKGSCEIDNVEFWQSVWIKTKRDGSGKFMSISYELKEGQVLHSQRGAPVAADVPIDTADFGAPATHPADDDIPF